MWIPTDVCNIILTYIPQKHITIFILHNYFSNLFPVRYNEKEIIKYLTWTDACKYNSILLLKLLKKHKKQGYSPNDMDWASRRGYLEVVKWLHKNNKECTHWAIDGAASGGHLEMVKWLHENRREGCTHEAMDWAAKKGHLRMLKWLEINTKEGFTFNALTSSTLKGHIKVLKWLCKNLEYKLSESMKNELIRKAKEGGHQKIVNWLKTDIL